MKWHDLAKGENPIGNEPLRLCMTTALIRIPDVNEEKVLLGCLTVYTDPFFVEFMSYDKSDETYYFNKPDSNEDCKQFHLWISVDELLEELEEKMP